MLLTILAIVIFILMVGAMASSTTNLCRGDFFGWYLMGNCAEALGTILEAILKEIGN